jgi:hypothetical protein
MSVKTNIQTQSLKHKQKIDEMKSAIASKLKSIDFSQISQRQDIRSHLSLAVTF